MAEDIRAAALASLTPLQRIEWLEQMLDLLCATDALAADRERRRVAAAGWAPVGTSARAAERH